MCIWSYKQFSWIHRNEPLVLWIELKCSKWAHILFSNGFLVKLFHTVVLQYQKKYEQTLIMLFILLCDCKLIRLMKKIPFLSSDNLLLLLNISTFHLDLLVAMEFFSHKLFAHWFEHSFFYSITRKIDGGKNSIKKLTEREKKWINDLQLALTQKG